jgi:ribosomal-protein-alanine N-acetyltransferase
MDRILEIDRKCFSDRWSEEEFLVALRGRNCIGTVFGERIFGDDEIKGFMVYELHKHNLHVLRFAVDPDWQRRGLATAAMERLVAKMDVQKRTYITADVHEANLGAQLLLASCGFKCESVLGRHGEASEYHFVWRLA